MIVPVKVDTATRTAIVGRDPACQGPVASPGRASVVVRAAGSRRTDNCWPTSTTGAAARSDLAVVDSDSVAWSAGCFDLSKSKVIKTFVAVV